MQQIHNTSIKTSHYIAFGAIIGIAGSLVFMPLFPEILMDITRSTTILDTLIQQDIFTPKNGLPVSSAVSTLILAGGAMGAVLGFCLAKLTHLMKYRIHALSNIHIGVFVKKSMVSLSFLTTGIMCMTLLYVFPQLVGRAEGLSLLEVYADSFIWYVYISSIPFFYALFLTHKIIQQTLRTSLYSRSSIKILTTIQTCLYIVIAALFGALAYINAYISGSDDSAGGIITGLFLILVMGMLILVTRRTIVHISLHTSSQK